MRISILVTLSFWAASVHAAPVFRFHLLAEPHNFDPQTVSASSGNYFIQNLYRGLYRYHSTRGLIYDGAESCTRHGSRQLTCKLNTTHRWSNGEPIVAEDYVRSFRRLADPNRRSPLSEIILSVKNGREILAGKLPPEKLGVTAVDAVTVRFDLGEDDPEFEYRLTAPATGPWPKVEPPPRDKASELLTSGPYKIAEWKSGSHVRMVPNPYYGAGPGRRPGLEAYFIDDDSTALRLYETGKLDFLRRVTYEDIPRYSSSKEFHQFQVARFDYIGFGEPLDHDPILREALARSIDFKTYKGIVDNRGLPGCPTLPKRMLDRQPCVEFSPAKARELLSKVKEVPKLTFYFSKMGGDDIAKTVAWIQGQWKKNLNLSVELNGEEQGMYLHHLKAKPPTLFRKGVALDRPTCQAGLEIFSSDHPENYLRLKDPEYDRLVVSAGRAKSEAARKVACRVAIEHLLKTYRMIPLGEMFFAILAKPTFKGWDLNELNQLDLTDLEPASAGP